MISIGDTLLHYKRPEIQKEIVACSKDREIATRFREGFGERPDTLTYPQDILELTKAGATSFHMSEERWSNVSRLSPKLKKKDLDDLRIGWDLILDIDCKFLEYSKIAADLLIKALQYQGINSVSCKFSGGTGFHISVPFEAFPEKVHQKETKDLFPEGTRRIAVYLKEMIKTSLSKEILKVNDIDTIIKKTGKKFKDLVKDNQFDPFTVLDIDTILISSRHLIRMPYCFNEKTGLISIPVDPKKVLDFNLDDAKSKNVVVSKFKFLDASNAKSNEAKKLIVQAFDFEIKKEEPAKGERKFEEITTKVPEEFFPPCIKKGLEGLEDGRKRFVFIMVNFLRCVGWHYEDIETLLKEWNKKNREELREIYIVSQIRYHKSQKKRIPPPNCGNDQYYKSIGIYTLECNRMKNPVSYTLRKLAYLNKRKPRKKKQ
ncbi:hypothetical protein KY313_02490 [Candidatus Woesearchaeota archaeon]|jgi:DNA primase large subunit|nr:hypothetical protein [Candidatus Woesearchaeota archaeon]